MIPIPFIGAWIISAPSTIVLSALLSKRRSSLVRKSISLVISNLVVLLTISFGLIISFISSEYLNENLWALSSLTFVVFVLFEISGYVIMNLLRSQETYSYEVLLIASQQALLRFWILYSQKLKMFAVIISVKVYMKFVMFIALAAIDKYRLKKHENMDPQCI